MEANKTVRRTKEDFCDGWKFHRGEIACESAYASDYSYIQANTMFRYGIHSPDYMPYNWRNVRVPHDFVIDDIPDICKDNAQGFLVGENSWYRKTFVLTDEDRDKCISIHFEGIAVHSEIWLNGSCIARNFSAYNPIDVDVTDYVVFDEQNEQKKQENVLCVHIIIPERPEGWWYQGGGIYRRVWLVKTDKLCVDLWGVYVDPQKTSYDKWNTRINTTVKNDYEQERAATVVSKIMSAGGDIIGMGKSTVTVPPYSKANAFTSVDVVSPDIWDVEHPNMYTLVTEIYDGERLVDEVRIPFGYREFYFDAGKGFFLNGRHVKIKGVCAHQDYGLTGIVLPEAVAEYRLRLMKEMGVNAYRSAHNMSDEATMDACDRLGLLVMDETRYFESCREGLRMCEQMVKRDRNHPSVIAWSIGNEETERCTENGRRIAARMSAFVKLLDSTRPTTIACNGYFESTEILPNKMYDAIKPVDIVSFNYGLSFHDTLHTKLFPDKPFIVTESCALQTSRAYYFADDETKGLSSAYDHVWSRTVFNNRTRSETHDHIISRDYIAGSFVWAGIEHRGETQWPRLCSQSGLVDMYLLKKDAFYQTKSQYTTEPMVHIVPASWNFEGFEGEPIRVVVYTNCDEVELLLNGKSLGKKKTPENYENPEWSVPYEAGELMAKGYRKGEEFAIDTQVTSGAAVGLRIKVENQLKNTGDTLIFTCYCEDESGRYVPDASPFVSFSVEGGRILGTGSDVTDHVPPCCSDRKMRMGQIAVAVESQKKQVILYAEANGLKKAKLCVSRADI